MRDCRDRHQFCFVRSVDEKTIQGVISRSLLWYYTLSNASHENRICKIKNYYCEVHWQIHVRPSDGATAMDQSQYRSTAVTSLLLCHAWWHVRVYCRYDNLGLMTSGRAFIFIDMHGWLFAFLRPPSVITSPTIPQKIYKIQDIVSIAIERNSGIQPPSPNYLASL